MKGAVLGREAMAALEKATCQPRRHGQRSVGGRVDFSDTKAIINLSSRIEAAQAARTEEDQQALPFNQATAQRE